MVEATDMHEMMLKRWAKEVARLYNTVGPEATGDYLVENVPETYHEALHPYVRELLEEMGWVFNHGE